MSDAHVGEVHGDKIQELLLQFKVFVLVGWSILWSVNSVVTEELEDVGIEDSKLLIVSGMKQKETCSLGADAMHLHKIIDSCGAKIEVETLLDESGKSSVLSNARCDKCVVDADLSEFAQIIKRILAVRLLQQSGQASRCIVTVLASTECAKQPEGLKLCVSTIVVGDVGGSDLHGEKVTYGMRMSIGNLVGAVGLEPTTKGL